MSGILPVLDRIATIEARFARHTPPGDQALGGMTAASSRTTGPGAASTDTATSSTARFDEVLALAEAALPDSNFDRTNLPPGLAVISPNGSPTSTSSPIVATVSVSPPATRPVATTHPVVGSVVAMPVTGTAAATAPVAAEVGAPVGAGVVPVGTPFATEFTAASNSHGVPADLLAAVGWVESRYDVTAVSPDGAIGVMQIMPGTAADLGVDPSDPVAAIDGAARLLRTHYERFGTWELALAAYFSGGGAVARNGNQAPPRGAEYAQRVIRRMETA